MNCTKNKRYFSSQSSVQVKGISIIMMLTHHCFLSPERYEGQTLTFIIPEPYWNYVALFFKICVCLFVFISSYGLTQKLCSLQNTSMPTLTYSLVLPRLTKLLGNYMFVFILASIFCLFYEPIRFCNVYGTNVLDGICYYILDLFGLAEFFGTKTFLSTYWYYSLAIIIIFITPLFYMLIRKIGSIPFLSLITIITFSLEFRNSNTWHYLLCIAVGIVCAYKDLINKLLQVKLHQNIRLSSLFKFLLETIFLILLMLLREGSLKGTLYPIWDAVIPVVFICFCCEFIFIFEPLAKIFNLLGKHSANIFLVHNYIRIIWFYDYTYSFQYPFFIIIMLLIESLILSFVIEWLKKITHFYDAIEHFSSRISLQHFTK